MATDEGIKIYTIIFIVLSGNDHSVKVSSNSEMGPGMALWDFLVLSENWCLLPCINENKNHVLIRDSRERVLLMHGF